jgi:nitrate/TMAO reductase-like tetraheme cytochrome c subunit
VQSKLAGTRQLIEVMTNRVPRPVPPPPELISPARATCERCHWPERFIGDRTRVIREFGNDEKNTPSETTLQLHVGGGSRARGVGTGIHWHMNLDNEIEFVTAADNRDSIPYVRLRDRAGNVREYFADGATAQQIAAGTRQRMDCMDCHNRPAHTFAPSATRAVDDALAQSLIPRELPFIRRESIAAIRQTYTDRPAAMNGIASHLRGFYSARGVDAAQVDRAIRGAQDAWASNVFPAMKVTWGTYPSNIGHVDSPGCFRCHDDSHKTKDGQQVIAQDCELCHSIQ